MLEEVEKLLLARLCDAVAGSLETVAKQYEKEPDGLYSGFEVSESIRMYAQSIRELGEEE